MLLPSLVQVSESISGSVVPLAMFFKYYSISWNLNRCVFSRVTYRYQWRGWFDRYSSFSSKRCYEDHTVPWWGKTSFTKNVILWKTFTNGGVYSLRIPQWYEGLHDDMKTNHSMIWRTIRAYNDMKDHTMIWRTIQWYESPYAIHHTPYAYHMRQVLAMAVFLLLLSFHVLLLPQK